MCHHPHFTWTIVPQQNRFYFSTMHFTRLYSSPIIILNDWFFSWTIGNLNVNSNVIFSLLSQFEGKWLHIKPSSKERTIHILTKKSTNNETKHSKRYIKIEKLTKLSLNKWSARLIVISKLSKIFLFFFWKQNTVGTATSKLLLDLPLYFIVMSLA